MPTIIVASTCYMLLIVYIYMHVKIWINIWTIYKSLYIDTCYIYIYVIYTLLLLNEYLSLVNYISIAKLYKYVF